MAQKAHWPFGQNSDEHSTEADRELERQREREAEREQARLAAEATRRQMQRHDRLIVGGRAHTKKHGLS
jgi:hypothetical protein